MATLRGRPDRLPRWQLVGQLVHYYTYEQADKEHKPDQWTFLLDAFLLIDK
jgi:hypothetical protein